MKKNHYQAIIFLTLLNSSNSWAVYKCVENNKTTYSGTPCATSGNTQQQTIKVPPSAAPDPVNAARLERETRQYKIAEQRRRNAEDAIAGGYITSNMTPSEVKKAIGPPITVNINGSRVQWVYEHGDGRRYIYFVNDLTE
jgi:hypothetical protein